MTNRQKFEQLVTSIAHINHVVSLLENMGLGVDDSSFDGSLFKSYDGLVPQALEYLYFKDYKESEEIYTKIITAELEEKDELIKELWDKYGIE